MRIAIALFTPYLRKATMPCCAEVRSVFGNTVTAFAKQEAAG